MPSIIRNFVAHHESNVQISDWPAGSKRLARDLINKYDNPVEATQTMLIWYFNGPWNRTILNRQGVRHNFPRPHTDILSQTISYRVPIDNFEDLLTFNGSLTIDRTQGEITANCDSEQLNFVVLNLAHDIIQGRRSVEEARRACSNMARHLKLHWPDRYSQGLRFTSNEQQLEPEGRSPFPDVPSVKVG